MSPRKRRSRRLAGPLLLAALAGAAAARLAAGYHGWVVNREHYLDFAKAAKPEDACKTAACPPLTPAQANQLGWATPSVSPRAYFRLPPEKKPGATRIGLFGCSFTAGTEAAPGQDIAAHLQRRFDAAGERRVEVVNFGVMGFGLHQAYLLWSYLHDRYALDRSVFLAMRFHRQRDTTFLFSDNAYGPIHARYAVEDGRARLIEAVGDSPASRSAAYFRWLPPWRYWRYDEKPPAWMRALLPSGRRWKLNPFYYRKADGDEEALESYVALFGEASRAAGGLVVDSDAPDLTRRLRSALGPGAGLFMTSPFWDLSWRDQELYYAPHGHLSALGNWTRAAVLYAALTGRPTEVELPSLAPLAETPRRPRAPALDEAAAVSVRAAGLPADVFVYYDGAPGWLAGPPPDFKKEGIASLLLDDHGERPIAGLRERLRDGEPVTLHFRLPFGAVDQPVGVIRTADGVTGRLELSTGAFSGAVPGNLDRFWAFEVQEGDYMSRASLYVPALVSDIALIAPSGPLLTGRLEPSRALVWKPAEARYFLYLRVPEEGWIDPPRYRSARTLDLVLRRPDGREVRSPLYSIRWRRARFGAAGPEAPAPLAARGKLLR